MIYVGNGIYSDATPNEYLMHYGVIGMKWGVHRAKEHEKNIYRHNRANGMSRQAAKQAYRDRMAGVKQFARNNHGTGLKSRDIYNRSREEARNTIDNYDKKLKAQRRRKAIAVGLGAAAAGTAAYSGYRLAKGLKADKKADHLWKRSDLAEDLSLATLKAGNRKYAKNKNVVEYKKHLINSKRYTKAALGLARKSNKARREAYDHGFESGRHGVYAALIGGAAGGVALANKIKTGRQMKKKKASVEHSERSPMDHQNDFLMHHGVEGQKWGHKHGPPYPLDDNPSKQAYKKHKAAHGGESNKPKTQREIAKQERADYKKKKLPKTSFGLLFKNKNMSEAEYREASKKIKRDREVYDGVIHDLYNLEKALNLPGQFLNDGVKTMKNVDYIVGMLTGTSMYDAAKMSASNRRSKKAKLMNEFKSIEQSDMSDSNFLAHYGVMGMKWGVRNAREASDMFHQTESYTRKKVLDDLLRSRKISRQQYAGALARSKFTLKNALKANKAGEKQALNELKKSGKTGKQHVADTLNQLEAKRKGFNDVRNANLAMKAGAMSGGLAGALGAAAAGGKHYKKVYDNYYNNNRSAIEMELLEDIKKFSH